MPRDVRAPPEDRSSGEEDITGPCSEPGTAPTLAGPSREPEIELRPGERIDRFQVVELLGAGAMGLVYLARDPKLERLVAIKLMRAAGRSAEARLLREARALARLRHPAVVTVHEVGVWKDQVYLAMEYVRGATLREWLASGPDWRERLAVLGRAARGLIAAHRAGLVHRDFKPDNVVVGDDGSVCVLDFGLAVSPGEPPDQPATGPATGADGDPAGEDLQPPALPDVTRTGLAAGTPGYMPPEQWTGQRCDARSDQFAFCATAYEALLGTRPYAGNTLAAVRDATLAGRITPPAAGSPAPRRIRRALLRGLMVDPGRRHLDMSALLREIERADRDRLRPVVALGVLAAVALVAPALFTARSDPAGAPAAGGPAGRWAKIVAASRLPPALQTPVEGDPLQTTVHRLNNGLTVYLSPNRSRPRISAAIAFRAGWSSETEAERGAAHLILQLAFNGTERIGTVDFAAERPLQEEIGALYRELPAATDPAGRQELLRRIEERTIAASRLVAPDEYRKLLLELGSEAPSATMLPHGMVFEVEIPSNQLEVWSALEADRWTRRVPRLFAPTVGTVLEQLREGDSTDARLEERILAGLFPPAHPLAVSLAERRSAVAAQPYWQVQAFADRWLVPNNAAILLSGDIDREAALRILEREFGAWEPRTLPGHERPAAERPAGGDVIVPSTGERAVHVAMRIDRPADLALVHIMDRVFDDTVAEDRLFDTGRMIDAHSSWKPLGGGSVLWRATVLPAAEQTLEEARAALLDAIAALRAGAFTDRDVERSIRNARVEILQSLHDNRFRGRRLAEAYLSDQAWPDRTGDGALGQVTRARILELVRTQLSDGHLVARVEPGPVELPAIDKPPMGALELDPRRRSAWARSLIARDLVPLQPKFLGEGRDYSVLESAWGPLIASRNDRTDLFELEQRIDMGRSHHRLVCATLVSLYQTPNGDELGKQFAELGLRWSIECGADQVRIRLSGPDSGFDAGIHAMLGFLRPQRIARDDWELGLARTRRQETDYRANRSVLQSALAEYALLGEASSYLTMAGPARLRQVAPEEGEQALAALVGATRSLLYFGPRSAEEVASALGEPPVPLVSYPATIRRMVRPSRPRIYLLDAEEATSGVHASVYMPLDVTEAADLVAIEVFNDYVSGAASEIQHLLSDSRGIAASASAEIRTPWPGGAHTFGSIRLELGPDRVVEAIELAIAQLVRAEIDPQLLEAARQSTEQSYRSNWIEPRRVPRVVDDWRQLGWSGDPRAERFHRIPGVTLEDVRALQRALAATAPVITVYGNLSRIDRRQLGSIGDVVPLRTSDILPP